MMATIVTADMRKGKMIFEKEEEEEEGGGGEEEGEGEGRKELITR